LTDRGKRLGKDLAVAAMRAEDVVLGHERKGHADCRCFLPDREVRGTGVGVGHSLVRPLGFDLLESGLELANGAHVAPDVHQVLGRVFRKLLLDRLVVRVDRNRGEGDRLPREDSIRFDDDGLGHMKS
jgi:hypothetical protein